MAKKTPLITVKMFAKKTTYSYASLQRMCQKDLLPHIMVGKRYYIETSKIPDLLKIVEKHRLQMRRNQATKVKTPIVQSETLYGKPARRTATFKLPASENLQVATLTHAMGIRGELTLQRQSIALIRDKVVALNTFMRAFAASVGYAE